MIDLKWDRRFLRLAQHIAQWSKDPSTKCGAVIVGPDKELMSTGFNGFPRLISDTLERLNHRDTKLQLVVHAEMNAVLAAARIGVSLKSSIMYISATDISGAVWGGPPCARCTVEIIQTGITEVVSWSIKAAPSRWHESLTMARKLLEESGINYREIEYEGIEL